MYSVSPLDRGREDLEAKAFTLKSLSGTDFEARKSNMHKLSRRKICSIDQAGRKFIVYRRPVSQVQSTEPIVPFVLRPSVDLLNAFSKPKSEAKPEASQEPIQKHTSVKAKRRRPRKSNRGEIQTQAGTTEGQNGRACTDHAERNTTPDSPSLARISLNLRSSITKDATMPLEEIPVQKRRSGRQRKRPLEKASISQRHEPPKMSFLSEEYLNNCFSCSPPLKTDWPVLSEAVLRHQTTMYLTNESRLNGLRHRWNRVYQGITKWRILYKQIKIDSSQCTLAHVENEHPIVTLSFAPPHLRLHIFCKLLYYYYGANARLSLEEVDTP